MPKVLVVEDDKHFNKLFSDFLQLEGFEVVSVLDGDSAFTELETAYHSHEAFDFLVADMLLPKKMGAHLFNQINELDRYSNLTRFAMSGIYKNQEEIQQIKILCGLQNYWTKPFSLEKAAQEMKNLGKSGSATETPGNKQAPEKRSSEAQSQASLGAGNLIDKSVERVFFDAYRKAFTGKLRLIRDGRERRVHFLNGHPVAADSSAIEESFGQALVRMELITNAQRDQISRQMVIQQKHFGEILVESGLLTNEEVFKALRKHTYRLLVLSFLSRQGDYLFEEMRTIPDYLPRIEFNPFLLMLEAQKRLIRVEALASLYTLKMESFPRKSPRWSQLLPLLHLPKECFEKLIALDPSKNLRSALKEIPHQYREIALRSLYLMENIQILDWANTPEKEIENLHGSGFFAIEKNEILTSEEQATIEELDDRISSLYMDILNQNYFELLNVTPRASEKELHNAYREMRFKNHPDRFGDQINGQSQRILDDILSRLDQAYQVLSDTRQRQEYEKSIQRLSEDSALDSKRYLEALDLFRSGQKELQKDKFAAAQMLFEKAYAQWQSGVEYRMYAKYAKIKAELAKNPKLSLNDDLKAFREFVYSHPQSETGFLLLGHLYRANQQLSAARDAYKRVHDLNPSSEEAANALGRLAAEANQSTPFLELNQKLLKNLTKVAGYLLLLGLAAGAYSQKDYFASKDPLIAEVEATSIQRILPALAIRHKSGMAKITISSDWIATVPDSVLRSKCLQTLEALSMHGIVRLYLIEQDAGLKAYCDDNGLRIY